MGLKFHQGDKPIYAAYTKNKAWNDDELLKNPKNNAPNPEWLKEWNTETKVKETLRCPLSRMFYANQPDELTKQVGALLDGDPDGLNLWVIKGFHQVEHEKANDLLKTHLTIGLDGQLWHFDCRMPRGTMTMPPHVIGVSHGSLQTTMDADGFEQVTGKKKRGRRH